MLLSHAVQGDEEEQFRRIWYFCPGNNHTFGPFSTGSVYIGKRACEDFTYCDIEKQGNVTYKNPGAES
jgi:hypothetical protein